MKDSGGAATTHRVGRGAVCEPLYAIDGLLDTVGLAWITSMPQGMDLPAIGSTVGEGDSRWAVSGPSLGRPWPLRGDRWQSPTTVVDGHSIRPRKLICNTPTVMPKPGELAC
jgi:hypothetical protein